MKFYARDLPLAGAVFPLPHRNTIRFVFSVQYSKNCDQKRHHSQPVLLPKLDMALSPVSNNSSETWMPCSLSMFIRQLRVLAIRRALIVAHNPTRPPRVLCLALAAVLHRNQQPFGCYTEGGYITLGPARLDSVEGATPETVSMDVQT